MNRIYYKLVIAVALYFWSTINLFSGESGWEQRNGYKYQKLIMQGLNTLQTSPSGEFLYTYSDILITWDFQTGKLVDSVRFIPQPNLFNFSKDGKTVVLGYLDTLQVLNKIKVFDLVSKKIVAESKTDFKTFPIIHIEYNSDRTSTDKITHFMDYVSRTSKLYLNIIANNVSSAYDSPTEEVQTSTKQYGYFRKMENKNDSLVEYAPLCYTAVIDYLLSEDSVVALLTHDYSEGNLWYLTQTKYKYTSYRYSNSLLSYSYGVGLHNSREGSGYNIGQADLTPVITNIYPTNTKDTIIYKNASGDYSLYDVKNGKTLGSSFKLSIEGKSIVESMLTNNIFVVYNGSVLSFFKIFNSVSQYNSIYGYIKQIATPIKNISSFVMNAKSLVAYNPDGEIIVIDVDSIVNVSENTTSIPDKSVYPNPTTGQITLDASRFHSGQLRIELADIAGTNKVLFDGMYENQELQFNIADYPNGAYTITACQNGAYHTYKIIKAK